MLLFILTGRRGYFSNGGVLISSVLITAAVCCEGHEGFQISYTTKVDVIDGFRPILNFKRANWVKIVEKLNIFRRTKEKREILAKIVLPTLFMIHSSFICCAVYLCMSGKVCTSWPHGETICTSIIWNLTWLKKYCTNNKNIWFGCWRSGLESRAYVLVFFYGCTGDHSYKKSLLIKKALKTLYIIYLYIVQYYR